MGKRLLNHNLIKMAIQGIPPSLKDAIIERPDDFVKEIRGNHKIIDFVSFREEYRKVMFMNNAQPYLFQDLDGEILKSLFRSQTVRRTIETNIGKDASNKIYEQSETTTQFLNIPQTQLVSFNLPQKKEIKGYDRSFKGKVKHINSYQKSKPTKWSNAQTNFLKVRIERKISPKQIISEFQSHFLKEQRSKSSIKTKIYRL